MILDYFRMATQKSGRIYPNRLIVYSLPCINHQLCVEYRIKPQKEYRVTFELEIL